MSVPFDPYHKWLGIPQRDQPANHYRLLGIDLFEDDAQVVEAAADRQMSFLRKYQLGEHAAEAQKVLNEVSRARICLLKPESKAAYDASLRGEPESKVAAVPPAVHLVVSQEDGLLIECPLVANQICLIGRGPVATLRFNDPYTSRAHCQIESRGARWVITDLDSSMGTFVNGDRIRRVALQPDDQIVVGRTRMRVTAGIVPPLAETHPVAETTPASAQNRIEDFLGKTIHHYFLERVLAEGARSTVFLARHVERQKDLVVQILKPTARQDDLWRRQFVSDFKVFLEVKHPNIVRLHSTGRLGPYCWLAMEYVCGENLRQTIASVKGVGIPDWQTSFRVALDIARALGAAESQQIVHGNLTPKSILLRSSDKVAKLADLLLANTWSATPVSITPHRELAYLAPERVLGTSNADHRSDIYGLGATVYGLLTGRAPFEVESLQHLQHCLANEQPLPPSRHNPSIWPAFEGVVLQMLAATPEARYQSAQELITDLERVGREVGISRR
ncbi:MAG: putative serine/threonine protein kinase [Planctomycetaceae bacterium]|nr:putative serine/threonine protein kinase [Planctomycetaceae bacterium]